MLTVYSERQKLHNPPTEFLGGTLVNYFEMPERVDRVLGGSRQGIGPFKRTFNRHRNQAREFFFRTHSPGTHF